MIKKLSYFSSVTALILLTIGISTSSALFVSLGCVCALVGWALKSRRVNKLLCGFIWAAGQLGPVC